MYGRYLPMKTLATLSTLGLPQSPPELCAKLIQYYNESNWSQSNLFFGKTLSLAATLQQFQNNPSQLTTHITNDLNELLGNYFNNVDINSSVIDNDDGSYDVSISGSYSQGGQVYQINETYKKSI